MLVIIEGGKRNNEQQSQRVSDEFTGATNRVGRYRQLYLLQLLGHRQISLGTPGHGQVHRVTTNINTSKRIRYQTLGS